MFSTFFFATRILAGILCLATFLAIVISERPVLKKQSHEKSHDRAGEITTQDVAFRRTALAQAPGRPVPAFGYLEFDWDLSRPGGLPGFGALPDKQVERDGAQ